jgi:small subunit ribosomal protein S7
VEVKLFNKWDTKTIKISDPGLQDYINLKPLIVPHTGGRNAKIRFGKRKTHVVERLINKLMVTGHYSGGKKHYFTSGRNTGKKATLTTVVEKAFEIVEKKTKKNPVQVLIEAVENGAPRAEITSVEFGGIRHPVAVDTAPKRRLDIALGLLAKGAMKRSLKNKSSLEQCLAEEITLASQNDPKALTVEKRAILEKQAEASK